MTKVARHCRETAERQADLETKNDRMNSFDRDGFRDQTIGAIAESNLDNNYSYVNIGTLCSLFSLIVFLCSDK